MLLHSRASSLYHFTCRSRRGLEKRMQSMGLLDKFMLALFGIMGASLAGAMATGILHILWVGSPGGARVAQIAFTLGFIFGGALLISFLIAAYEECRDMAQLKPTDPNEFGAEV
jgi:hypothetical protein